VNVVKKYARCDTLSILLYATDLHIYFSETSPTSENQGKDKAAIVKPLLGTDLSRMQSDAQITL